MKKLNRAIPLLLCAALLVGMVPLTVRAENSTLAPDVVVIDYGLDVLIDIGTNDTAGATPVSLLTQAPEGIAINDGLFNFDTTGLAKTLDITNNDGTKVADATLEGDTIRFRLDRSAGLGLTQPYTFYYVSEIDDRQMEEAGCLYTSVTVIPAAAMYYEEDFVSYTGAWEDVGVLETDAAQDTDRPGPNSGTAGCDADNVYGFDSAYLNCPEYSLNSAKKVTVTGPVFTPPDEAEGPPPPEGEWPETPADPMPGIWENRDTPDPEETGTTAMAAFTFSGTGFDVIGRMDQRTGTILVRIRQGDAYLDFTENFVPQMGRTVQHRGNALFLDTYCEGANGIRTIPQVPVAAVRDLPYGTYTVEIEAVYNSEYNYRFGADRNTGEADFYLDAVRIYDPAGAVANAVQEGVIADAYDEDLEWGPGYEAFRNEVMKEYGGKTFEDAVFVDKYGTASEIARHEICGPNNELYLPSGCSIVLPTDPTALQDLIGLPSVQDLADIQLGFRLTTGKPASVRITNGQKTRNIDLTSATDLNFSVREFYGSTMTIENMGSGHLTITTIKVTVVPARSIPGADVPEEEEEPTIPGEQSDPEQETEESKPPELPEKPEDVISRAIIFVKVQFAGVIVAVANIMERISQWLQNLAGAI